ncbi:hypothetical protein [Aequorivita capsosiphonis]|uniref:hypothetical protein n=1 Tax=Aequorivita capsosiphonis TaxID=487317 RepID=UPI0012FCD0DC|nr:hypothetical protein [Aequorivita capsosiphonis]
METTLIILQTAFMALYVIVFVVAIFKFPLYKETPLKFIPFILLFTILTEFLGQYIKDEYGEIITNVGLFNIYYLFYFSFFFYVFMKVIEEKRFKRYIKIGIIFFWIIYLSDLIFTDIFTESFIRSYIAGAGILIFCILLYYISILQSSLVLVVKNDLLFWISVGLFLFYIGYIPIKIIKSWYYVYDDFFQMLLIIQFSLIIVMYSFFLIGFLWMKKR